MKMDIVSKEWMLVAPRVIMKKSESDLVFDPTSGLRSNVLTYLVTDCNGSKEYDGKIVGMMKADVWPFLTIHAEFHLARKASVIFIAEKEDGEEIKDPKDKIDNRKGPFIDTPPDKIIIT